MLFYEILLIDFLQIIQVILVILVFIWFFILHHYLLWPFYEKLFFISDPEILISRIDLPQLTVFTYLIYWLYGGKNIYRIKSWIWNKKTREIIKCFSLDLLSSKTHEIIGLNPKTIDDWYLYICKCLFQISKQRKLKYGVGLWDRWISLLTNKSKMKEMKMNRNEYYNIWFL